MNKFALMSYARQIKSVFRTLRKSPRQCRGESGFSLIEIIVVMVVIGILAIISIPGFLHWMPDIRLKAAARDLYANMQKAKVNAVTQNREWAVIFNSTANTYSLCDDSIDGNWATQPNHCVETVALAQYKSGVRFGHGNATSPKGSSFDGGDGDDVSYNHNLVAFRPQGFGGSGYAYLEHKNRTTTFAVGTTFVGGVKILRWKGSWQ